MNEPLSGRPDDSPADHGLAEDLFESLLEQFDAASAEGATPIALQDQTLPEPMRGELLELQQCLSLLNQAARQGALSVFDAATDLRLGETTGGQPLEDRSFVGERIGRFELVREIGRGGYGIVFLAHDVDMARDVALKLPRPEALVAPEFRRRFIREAQAAGRLDHPHVLPVYEAGEDGGLCYLVTPYCRGPSLAQWMAEQQGPVDPRAAAALIAALAEGLEQAHQLRVLHRDIKPGNVLLDLSATEHPAQGARLVERPLSSFVPKLTDFGLAKLLEVADQDTRTGAHLGTPAYMAPEAAAGNTKEVGASADIYALGAILYELLVGQPPLVGASDAETLRLTLTTDPVPPRQRRLKLPRDLDAVVLKCLEKSPVDRYATAGKLAADLRRFLAGDSTLARPKGVVRRVWKSARRRPAVTALVTLAGVLALALAVGGKWYSHRLERELHDRIERQYLRDVKTAINDRRDGVTDHARALLAGYAAPVNRNEDPRGFEWYWLKHSLDDQALVIPTGHGEVYGVTYSPDGELLYSGGQDGKIRIWNSHTGAAEGELAGHLSCVNQVAVTPDGARLASCSCDNTVRFWDLATRQPTGIRLEHPSPVFCQSLARRKPWLATGCEDGMVRVWDATSGTLLQSLKVGEPHSTIDAIEFSPDGGVLAATAGLAGTVVWSTDDWSEVRRIYSHTVSLTFCEPDQQLILGNGFDRLVNRWNYTQTDGIRTLHRFPTRVFCLRGAFANPLLAVGGGTIHVLNQQGQLNRVLSGATARVQGLAFSPDDRRIAAACFDGALRCWNVTGEYPSIELGNHTFGSVHVRANSPYVCVADDHFGTLVFDRESGRQLAEFPQMHTRLLSSRGKYLIAQGPQRQVIRLYPLANPAASIDLCPDTGVDRYAVSRDETTVAICQRDGTARVFDAATGVARCVVKFSAADWAGSKTIVLSDDGGRIYCNVAVGFDTGSGKPLAEPAEPALFYKATSFPQRSRYSPDGTMSAEIEDIEGVVVLVIRDARTRRVIREIHHEDSLSAIHCWSPDGKRLAVITADNVVVLLDAKSGEQVATLDRPTYTVVGLFFDEDGQSLKALMHNPNRLIEWYEWRAPREAAPIATAIK